MPQLTTRDRVLALLMAGGTWLNRAELAAASANQPAVDDTLAALVSEGLAEFRKNVGWRLSVTTACRRALQLLLERGQAAAVAGMPGDGCYCIGVAERRAEVGLVLYELQLPYPVPCEDELARLMEQVGGVMAFIDSRGGQHVRASV